jgi:hypothetical protein
MHILFIENREKTLFWNGAAKHLQDDGHQISWLVQNHGFGHGLIGATHYLPYPKPEDLDPKDRPLKRRATLTDRGRDHFGNGDRHYTHYWNLIGSKLDALKPDLVVGEPTLFHELMACEQSEDRGIPYIHPVGERYPQRRFAVFAGMSQVPFVQSDDLMSDEAALELADRIGANREVLTYMRRGSMFEQIQKRMYWLATRVPVALARFGGEKYNTPSIARKVAMNKSRDAVLKRWQSLSSSPHAGETSVMYPLQMQPENTIDVWGRPWFDQIELIRRMVASLPPGATVSVKANPKPYYELDDALLDYCSSEPRVRLLPAEMRMPEAMSLCIGAMTITGTVGFEAVCGRGRCISLCHPVLDEGFESFVAQTPEEAVRRLLTEPSAGCGDAPTGARLMQKLTRRSFPGTISDPVSDPASMAPENLGCIADGIRAAIRAVAAA